MGLDISLYSEDGDEVFDTNITHNLGNMAEAAGIYDLVWDPESLKVVYARDIIEPLEKGIKNLEDNPEFYKRLNAKNGWGLYENFVPFLRLYLDACQDYPDALIYTSS